MATQSNTFDLDNSSGVHHEGVGANSPTDRLSATSIIGGSVMNPQGEKLGTIDNIMINIHSGEVEYAVMEFGSLLGIGGKLFAVPFRELRMDPNKKVFILDRDKDYLKQAPGFDKTHWPDTNSHSYFENVKMYYGSYLPPFP